MQCYVIRRCTNCVWIFQYVLLYVLENTHTHIHAHTHTYTHTRASTYANPLQPSFSWAHPGWVSYGCNNTGLHWGQIFEEGDPAPKTWYHQAMNSKWFRCEKETTPIEADEPEPTRVLLLIHVESYPICVKPIYSHLNIYSWVQEIPTLRLDVYVIVNGSVSIRAITLLQKHIRGFLCLQGGFICWHMVRC